MKIKNVFLILLMLIGFDFKAVGGPTRELSGRVSDEWINSPHGNIGRHTTQETDQLKVPTVRRRRFRTLYERRFQHRSRSRGRDDRFYGYRSGRRRSRSTRTPLFRPSPLNPIRGIHSYHGLSGRPIQRPIQRSSRVRGYRVR